MNNKQDFVPHDYREIPNCQVLDAARDYHNAFNVLMRQPPGTGVLLAAIHNGAIAIELYLKSLSAHEVLKPHPEFAGGGIVYAQHERKVHDWPALFTASPEDAQNLLEEERDARDELKGFESFVKLLAAHSGMFISSRYPYEPANDVSAVRLDVFSALVDAVATAVGKVTHRLEPVADADT